MVKQVIRNIGIFGTGSWATALTKVLTDNKFFVNWYFPKKTIADKVKVSGKNPNYLSNIKLDVRQIQFYNNANMLVKNSDVLLFAIPSAFFLKTAKIDKTLLQDKILISAVKGIVPKYHQTLYEYFHYTLNLPSKNIVIISGPSHAEEVSLGKKTYLSFSSTSKLTAEKISKLFNTNYIYAHYSNDVKGVEYAAVLKNVYAIGIGIAHGLNYGDNFIAILLSRAAKEMYWFLHALHLNDRDFLSASYLGDLVVTAYSEYSRNRRLGNYVGKLGNVDDALKQMKMVAEGYYNAKSIHLKNMEIGVSLGFAESVYKILFHKKDPKSVYIELESLLN